MVYLRLIYIINQNSIIMSEEMIPDVQLASDVTEVDGVTAVNYYEKNLSELVKLFEELVHNEERMNMNRAAVVFALGLAAMPSLAAVNVTDKDYSIKVPAWKTGAYEWPSAYPKCVRSDWSGHDRLVIDVTNLGDDGDQIGFYAAGPDGKMQNGLRRSFALPAWETVRWEISLKYLPETVSYLPGKQI